MSRSINPTGVRIPADLHEWLRKQAAQNHRSLNGEIVARLESRLEQPTLKLRHSALNVGIDPDKIPEALGAIFDAASRRPGSWEARFVEQLAGLAGLDE